MAECSQVVRTPRPGLIDQVECRSGFMITGPCLGTAGTPICCNEEICGRIYFEIGGRPKTLDEQKALKTR